MLELQRLLGVQAVAQKKKPLSQMGKNIQNYWYFGLFPSSGILENRKHDVSETGSVSKMPYFLFSRILDDGKRPKNPVIPCVIHHRQNPLESTGTNISCKNLFLPLNISMSHLAPSTDENVFLLD
jgi:hypothetical protein